MATRFEASKDIIVIPAARTHEYVRASDHGIRAKLGLDCTVPFVEKARYARCSFEPTGVAERDLVAGSQALSDLVGGDF
jgi:2,5-furandicarboxylate decarboxylase 1